MYWARDRLNMRFYDRTKKFRIWTNCRYNASMHDGRPEKCCGSSYYTSYHRSDVEQQFGVTANTTGNRAGTAAYVVTNNHTY